MAFHDDLLEQAKHLVARDEQGRPKQANLRRAASGAYYALFHFLIDKACRSLIGTQQERQPMRRVMARAFTHRSMKKTSVRFAQKTLSSPLSAAVASPHIPSDLREIAKAFIELQQKRHEADYDLNRPLTRDDCEKLIDQSKDAIRRWDNVQNEQAAQLYLWALLVGEQVKP